MQTYNVVLKGVEPGFLMNRYSIEEQTEASKNSKKCKNPPTMQEELKRAEYRDEKGFLYMPAEWIYQSLLKASGEYKVPGRGKKSYRDYIKSAMIVEPENISLGKKEYSTDARSIVIRATRGRVMRYRPHVPEWKVEFTIVILDDELIDGETLHTILDRAGKTVGVGDFRPRYGRFIVETFKQVE